MKDINSNKVFISGSISIKLLPQEVKNSIQKIIENNIEILVGDADGIDTLVQNYCISSNYYNVTVYSIYSVPRYKANKQFRSNFVKVTSDIKRERERQQEKDKAMTMDSEFTFAIWDSKSKGSYANILRALENDKKVKVYLDNEKLFLKQNKITEAEIEFIFRTKNGYTASEVVQYLKDDVDDGFFEKTQDLNKYLIQKYILKKEEKIYTPMPDYENLFILDKYRGKIKGIKFKNEFIDWIEKDIKKERSLEQASLF